MSPAHSSCALDEILNAASILGREQNHCQKHGNCLRGRTSNTIMAVHIRANLYELEHHGTVAAASSQVQRCPSLSVLGLQTSSELHQLLSDGYEPRPVSLSTKRPRPQLPLGRSPEQSLCDWIPEGAILCLAACKTCTPFKLCSADTLSKTVAKPGSLNVAQCCIQGRA